MCDIGMQVSCPIICWTRRLKEFQARESQERHVQLSSNHPQQEDPSHSTQNVVGKRRQLQRTEVFHALGKASAVGRSLPTPYHSIGYQAGEGAFW